MWSPPPTHTGRGPNLSIIGNLNIIGMPPFCSYIETISGEIQAPNSTAFEMQNKSPATRQTPHVPWMTFSCDIRANPWDAHTVGFAISVGPVVLGARGFYWWSRPV